MKSARQPIIDLFLEVIDATPPIHLLGSENLNKARLANQLLNEGYLDGESSVDIHGKPGLVIILDITISGRRLCEELEEEVRSSHFSVKAGRTLKKGTVLLLSGITGLLGGVAGAVLIEIVLRWLNLK